MNSSSGAIIPSMQLLLLGQIICQFDDSKERENVVLLRMFLLGRYICFST